MEILRLMHIPFSFSLLGSLKIYLQTRTLADPHKTIKSDFFNKSRIMAESQKSLGLAYACEMLTDSEILNKKCYLQIVNTFTTGSNFNSSQLTCK